MPGWLKFSLLDMTPYDREGWLWLVESYQSEYPYHPVFALLYALLLLFFLLRKPALPRFALGLLGCAWSWCGVVFQMQYNATLNWAAPYLGWGFIVQAALLIGAAVWGKALVFRDLKSRGAWPGWILIGLAFAYPLVGLLEGRSLQQLEWLALMPTPTTLVTFGVLALIVSRWWLWGGLMLIPLFWAVVSAAFSLKLGLLEPYVSGVAVVLFFFARIGLRRG